MKTRYKTRPRRRKTKRNKRGGAKCETIQNTSLFDTEITGKKNKTWESAITDGATAIKVTFLTAINQWQRALETSNSLEFIVKLVNEERVQIMIKNRYIACFINLCGEWYAIMRLYGTVVSPIMLSGLNTPSDTFYKLKDVAVDDSSLITIKNYVEMPTPFSIFSTPTKIIKLLDSSVESVSNDVLPKLINFRNIQVVKKQAKLNTCLIGANLLALAL